MKISNLRLTVKPLQTHKMGMKNEKDIDPDSRLRV